MKKFCLSLIICVCLCFSVFAFSSCKKDEGYQLSNLFNDYKAIENDCKSVIFNNSSKRLEFDYSTFKNAKYEEYLTYALQIDPYVNLNNYNQLFYNSMSFANANLNVISTNSYAVSKNLRNDVKNELNNLKNAFIKVDIQVQEFARNINTNAGRDDVDADIVNDLYLSTFKHLLDSYNSLFESAFKFNICVEKIYYSLTDNYQNLNFTDKELLTDGEISNFLSGLPNRRNLVVSAYSFVFYANNLLDGSLSKSLTTQTEQNFGDMGAAFEEFEDDISRLPQTVDLGKISGYNAQQKENIRRANIELNNLWRALNNDFQKFNAAYSQVNYPVAKLLEDKTEHQTYCIKIVEDYFALINKNVESLKTAFERI